MHSRGIVQNPLSRKWRIVIALLVAALSIGFFWFFGNERSSERKTGFVKKTAAALETVHPQVVRYTIIAEPNQWTDVFLPPHHSFDFYPERCVKQKAFAVGKWRMDVNCPDKKPVMLGKNTGLKFSFQPTDNKPVNVQIVHYPAKT